MPGPGEHPVGDWSAAPSLYIVADKGDAAGGRGVGLHQVPRRAPRRSRQWAAATGYVPVRQDALDLEPLLSTYATDPRFQVAYDQLLAGPPTT